MGEFFLHNIINDITDTRLAIVEILKARGFLIDSKDGHHYISDNASVCDIDYLNYLLRRFNIGEVKNMDVRTRASRRNWDKSFGNISYPVEAPAKHMCEIVIYEQASVEAAISLFNMMERNGAEAGPNSKSWYNYSIELLPCKVPVSYLEGYIALYVKAISACGVETCQSCDGNHCEGGRIYVGSNYPYNIWHEIIWKDVVQKKFGDIPFIEKGIPFTEETQGDVYRTINEIANYLYENRLWIREMKKETMKMLSKKYIRPLIRTGKKKEIERFYKEVCEKKITNFIE